MVARVELLLAGREKMSAMRRAGMSSILVEKGDRVENSVDRLAPKSKHIQADRPKEKDVQEALFPDLSEIP